MRYVLIFIFFALAINIVSAQTQSQMTRESLNSLSQTKKDLNKLYQEILEEYKSDTVFIEKIKASQNLWLQFVEAEVEMKFPPREPGYYGSMHGMCVSGYRETLIEARIAKLREWMLPIPEGEGCGGSVK
jgi:uncharacterized protein YecT (DUF1311 family)